MWRLRFIAYLTAAALAAVVLAGNAAAAHAEKSTDGDEELLPINATPAEIERMRKLPQAVIINDPPPVAPIRNVAEYEPCTGVLIRYPLGIGYGLIREMSEDVKIYCVVSSANKNTAIANFQANNVNIAQVEWVVEPSNSIWTRDYGPWFVFDGNGDQVILDHHYNRPRPDDDVIPIALGDQLSIPVVSHDIWHAGGNYMTEGHGTSFSSHLVWDENWEMTHQEIADFFYDYYGVDTYNVLQDIQLDGIHHIDCWAKLLDEETVIVKRVASNHVDYNRIENAAAIIDALPNKYGRTFKVVRVDCPPIASGNVAAYTNSLILNKKLLMPSFGLPAADAAAMAAYQAAMPGYEVLSFSGGWLTDDALHCRAIGIADRYMLRVDHNPLQGSPAGVPMEINVYIDDRSEAGVDLAQTRLYWRTVGAPAFTAVQLQLDAEPDWYRAQIPSQPPGAQIEYYISARDRTGRVQTRPRTAPVATHKFTVDAQTGVKPPKLDTMLLTVGPSPFKFHTTGRFHLAKAGDATVKIYDVRGRHVATLLQSSLSAGDHEVQWNGKETNGAEAPSGVYFVVLNSAGEKITRRVLLLR